MGRGAREDWPAVSEAEGSELVVREKRQNEAERLRVHKLGRPGGYGPGLRRDERFLVLLRSWVLDLTHPRGQEERRRADPGRAPRRGVIAFAWCVNPWY